MAQHSVDIAVRARDEASATFRQVEVSLRGTVAQMVRDLNLAADFGKLAGGMYVLRTGLDVVRAGAAAAKGDVEAFFNILEHLPFGIGPFVQSVEEFVDVVGGFSAEIADLQKRTAEFGAFARGVKGVQDLRLRVERDIRLLSAADAERQAASIREKAAADIRRIEEEARNADIGVDHRQVEAAVRRVEEWCEKGIADVRAKALDAQAREAARAHDAEVKEAERRGEDIAVLERALERRRFDLTATARERELRDLDDYFAELQCRYRDNARVLAEITAAWGEERIDLQVRQMAEEAAEDADALIAQWRREAEQDEARRPRLGPTALGA